MKPRVVFLSKRFLHPLDTGGKIRTARLLEQLRERWRITLIGHYDAEYDAAGRSYVESLGERFVAVPKPRPTPGSVTRRLSRLVDPRPLAAIYDTDAALRAAIAVEVAAGADLFVCDFVQSSGNVPWPLPCASLLFTHNVEARILRRQAEVERGPRRLFWALQHRRMRAFEGAECARYDRVVAVSDSDREEFERAYGLAGRVRTIPTGVDFVDLPPCEPEADLVAFCGSMDYVPNRDGIEWFASEVLPRLRERRPAARLLVVGRRPPEAFVARHPGIEFTGWVEEVRPHLRRASAVIVPLRVGGGTRIKIYEAMALRLPVVSTGIGAEGLPLSPGEHYHRADEAAPFADAVARTLADRAEATAMAERAREYVVSRFGWPHVADVFAAAGDEAMGAFRGSVVR